jgi:hypothetical protein
MLTWQLDRVQFPADNFHALPTGELKVLFPALFHNKPLSSRLLTKEGEEM